MIQITRATLKANAVATKRFAPERFAYSAKWLVRRSVKPAAFRDSVATQRRATALLRWQAGAQLDAGLAFPGRWLARRGEQAASQRQSRAWLSANQRGAFSRLRMGQDRGRQAPRARHRPSVLQVRRPAILLRRRHRTALQVRRFHLSRWRRGRLTARQPARGRKRKVSCLPLGQVAGRCRRWRQQVGSAARMRRLWLLHRTPLPARRVALGCRRMRRARWRLMLPK